LVVSFAGVASFVVGAFGVASDFAHLSPKKYHALKRIIAAGINILNTILFTNLYWKLRDDDIFAILLYKYHTFYFLGNHYSSN
jgi:UDP-N-acetylmuramyl pentapeptide phosphotransferase/UDP-N-acetylglucosamine-1-phosphate transferase